MNFPFLPSARFKTSLSFIAFLVISGVSVGQTFVPGTTYYGRKNYTEYHPGNSPLIFSAPHGGSVSPSSIPDRTCNSPVLVADANTSDLAMRIDSACMKVFGCHPHIIICNMSRKKVDCNRAEPDGTCGNTEAALAWEDFHSFLDTAVQAVMAQYGKGFYIDLHGHGHPIQRLEMGYLIHQNELELSDSVLNKSADTLRFSMHTLWLNNKTKLSLSQLIRGPYALGTQLAAKGYPAVASQQDPYPQPADPYFDGGYNTDRYSSAQGGTIDGLQIEHNFTGVRDSYHNRAVYADTLVSVLKNFLLKYYFSPATLMACKLVTSDADEALPQAGFTLFPNPATNHFSIHGTGIRGPIQVDLYSLTGALIISRTLFGEDRAEFSLDGLSPGVYLVRLQSNKQVNTLKLMIIPH